MSVRALIPVPMRRLGRRALDRCFQRRGLGLSRIGGASAWTIMPDRLRPGAGVLSGGAGQDVSFELELATRFGCRVAMFDPSPTGRRTMDSIGVLPAGVTFHELGLSAETGMFPFSAPAHAAEGSYGTPDAGTPFIEFNCVSPTDALACARLTDLELVKIDIEGFEYGFLARMIADGIRPPQIAVEFHHFLPHISMRRTLSAVRNLKAAGYEVVHKEQCDYLFVHRPCLAR